MKYNYFTSINLVFLILSPLFRPHCTHHPQLPRALTIHSYHVHSPSTATWCTHHPQPPRAVTIHSHQVHSSSTAITCTHHPQPPHSLTMQSHQVRVALRGHQVRVTHEPGHTGVKNLVTHGSRTWSHTGQEPGLALVTHGSHTCVTHMGHTTHVCIPLWECLLDYLVVADGIDGSRHISQTNMSPSTQARPRLLRVGCYSSVCYASSLITGLFLTISVSGLLLAILKRTSMSHFD